MTQAISNLITRRSMVAGLALTAAPDDCIGGSG